MNLETATQYANEFINLLNPSCVRIEINEEYAKIARARLNLHQQQMKLEE